MMIPSGKAGIIQTLKLMRELVKNGKKTANVRQTAVDLTSFLPSKSWGSEIGTLFRFVRDQIRFVRDINGIETLHTPDAMLELRSGDCDDKSVLLASLLEAIGHPTRFVAVGRSAGEYEHVYVETKLGAKWIALDPSEPVEPGWEPPNMVSRLTIYN